MLDKKQIIVSGFPRSGNTFLRNLIKNSYTNFIVPIHIHNFAYVEQNYDKNYFIVPIRNPKDAIGSWDYYRDFYVEKNSHINNFDKKSGFFYYNNFYERVLKLSDKVLILDFDKFTSDVEYVYSSIYKFYSEAPEVKITIDDIKELMILNGQNINIPQNNKESLDIYKNNVLLDNDYYKCLELYNSILKSIDIFK